PYLPLSRPEPPALGVYTPIVSSSRAALSLARCRLLALRGIAASVPSSLGVCASRKRAMAASLVNHLPAHRAPSSFTRWPSGPGTPRLIQRSTQLSVTALFCR